MQQFSSERFIEAVSGFHLLVYVAACDMLPLKVRWFHHDLRVAGFYLMVK